MLKLSRREYLRLASAFGATAVLDAYGPRLVQEIKAAASKQKVCIAWLQGASDSGCSVSWLNSERPDVIQAILQLSVGLVNPPLFHLNVMPAAGFPVGVDKTKAIGPYYNADDILEGIFTGDLKGDVNVLIVEGSVQNAWGGRANILLEKNFRDWVKEKADLADVVVAVGECACWGGIPGGAPNPTEAVGLQWSQTTKGGALGAGFTSKLGLPVINVAGCPANPDWTTLSLAALVIGAIPELDEYNRPKAFYGTLIHDNCPRRGYYDKGQFAQKWGEEWCLWHLGCKGPVTYADCPFRLWNGVNFCTQGGANCISCTEPDFPDGKSPFFEEIEALPWAWLSPVQWAQIMAVATGVGVAAHAVRRLVIGRGKAEEE